MRFIKTPVFTRAVVELLDDEEYRSLQLALLLRQDLGPVIPPQRRFAESALVAEGRGQARRYPHHLLLG
jgi:hypothetical protein